MENPEQVTYFAQTDSRNRRVSFGIKAKDRSRHMYVIGKTGMGKSTLLENLAIQDLRNGEGMAFIDPHGKSADLLLDYVPRERIDDVLYFAPFDMDYPIGFNVMEDTNPDRRHLVVNGLMSTFEKIWEDAWSARMAYILQNTIHALLEYPGATLLDVNRMYTNKTFREKVVANIQDTSVRAFWEDEYASYTDRYTQEATPAIQNKIGQLASNPVIRNILGQPKSTFQIRDIMDNQKIIIVNLSKGKVGETNANLLGALMINKIYLGAMSRADVTERELNELPNFYLHVDEFQSFANRSFADILSESRKYKLNLTMAHQYIEQMSEEVRAAVFGNVGTMLTFRVGAYDAELLEKEFQPKFEVQDIVSLDFAQIYLKLMIDGVASPPFSGVTLPPLKKEDISYHDDIIDASRKHFARPREEVEGAIKQWQDTFSQADAQGGGKQGKGGQQKGGKGGKGGGKNDGGKQGGNNSGGGKHGGQDKQGSPDDLRSVLSRLSDAQSTKQPRNTNGNADAKKTAQKQSGQSNKPHEKNATDEKQDHNKAQNTPPTPDDGASGQNALRDALAGLELGAQSKNGAGKDAPKTSANQAAQKKQQQKRTKQGADATQNDIKPGQKAGAGEKHESHEAGTKTETAASSATSDTKKGARTHSASNTHSSFKDKKVNATIPDEPDGQGERKEERRYEPPSPAEVPKEVLDNLLSMDDEYDKQTTSFQERQDERNET